MLRKATISLLAAGAALALAAAPAAAQKQTLKMAYWTGPAHHMAKTIAEWVKMVEEASGGNLTIEVDTAALGAPPGQYDLVKNGVRDMVWAVTDYTPGRFEMLQIGQLPFLCPNATVCSPALWKWYHKHGFVDKEFTDTKVLNIFMHGPGGVHTVKPVSTLEQIKGIKIRAGGAGVPIGQALGMSIVAMPATEAHEALSRGTVEGVLFPWEAMDSFRLHDPIHAHLEIPGGMYTAAFVIIINPNSLSKLSPANQAALMKVSGVAGSSFYGKAWDKYDDIAREGAKKRGDTIQTLSAEQLALWKPKLQFVEDAWLKQAKDKGYDGAKLLEDFRAMIKAETM